MSANELEEVQALIERVLPDPKAFAGRLLQQAITQYGQFAEPAATALYVAAAEKGFVPDEPVVVTDQRAVDETSVDINLLLAAALGACECWGSQADCGLCQGQGSAGWIRPEPELFEEFVRPAIDRLAGFRDRSRQQPGWARTDTDSGNYQTVQGEST